MVKENPEGDIFENETLQALTQFITVRNAFTLLKELIDFHNGIITQKELSHNGFTFFDLCYGFLMFVQEWGRSKNLHWKQVTEIKKILTNIKDTTNLNDDMVSDLNEVLDAIKNKENEWKEAGAIIAGVKWSARKISSH